MRLFCLFKSSPYKSKSNTNHFSYKHMISCNDKPVAILPAFLQQMYCTTVDAVLLFAENYSRSQFFANHTFYMKSDIIVSTNFFSVVINGKVMWCNYSCKTKQHNCLKVKNIYLIKKKLNRSGRHVTNLVQSTILDLLIWTLFCLIKFFFVYFCRLQ